MSTSQDPNPQGGSLTDMAVEGTTVPSDSATQRTIPSVPRPDQTTALNDPNDLGTTDLAGQADNTNDMPKVIYPSPFCSTLLIPNLPSSTPPLPSRPDQ